MKKVRYGVIGIGNMGRMHCRLIVEAAGRRFGLSAACDVDASREEAIKDYNVPFFTDAQAMYDSGLVDAVIVTMPHYWHPPLVFRAARAGINVLCEKPLACSVGPARAMAAECRKRKVAFGAMLQQRCRPAMVKAKQLVDKGALGELFRVEMICSSWFRTQKYYDSGQWRGTWDGEGGGVLINQAPHSLDLFQWIGMGLPKTIVANVATREHKMECEDTANVLCDYGKGRIGYIYATTAEEPGEEKLKVVGDKATMVIEGKSVRLGKLKMPVSMHIYGSSNAMSGQAEQELTWTDVKVPDKRTGHLDVIKAFAAHLLDGSPMVAGGEEAVAELEISSAAYLSGFNGSKLVSLPVDADEMERLLTRLIRQRSTGRGGNMRAAANRDMKRILAGKA
jgi:predicted dehydrogenase